MFQKARLKLTVWYLLIIVLISVGFSAVIYKALTQEIDRFSRLQRLRLERRFESEFIPSESRPRNIPSRIFIDPELAEETKRRLALFLTVVNGGILFAFGGLAYWLSGKTLKPIKEMIEEQNQFITDASHELKTPLTSLKSAMEVHLRDKNLNLISARTLISENIKEVDKLQSLSEGLLQLAQYRKPENLPKFEKVSSVSIVKKSIQKVKPQAREKAIIIKDEVQDFEFEGDEHGLTELLVILLDNALKYSQTGKSVVVTSKKTDGSFFVTVSDKGIGIEEKDLPHIFDRFYRADLARSKNENGGFGLGLSIARKIVDSHHGLISVESKPGEGSIFTVRFPVKQTFRKPFLPYCFNRNHCFQLIFRMAEYIWPK